jgi:hypothetical protein
MPARSSSALRRFPNDRRYENFCHADVEICGTPARSWIFNSQRMSDFWDAVCCDAVHESVHHTRRSAPPRCHRVFRYIRIYHCVPVDFMVRREQLWGVSRGKEPWRVPLEEEKVALDLFCATNNVGPGFRSIKGSGFLPTKDYRGPPWSLFSEVQIGGYVVNVRNSGRSTDENGNRQDSAPLFISNAYNTMRVRPRHRDERGP